jgi:prolyl-tRNA editing enzyme YbaK/EbsC (Cys-tRNA(Pro) deacylase)
MQEKTTSSVGTVKDFLKEHGFSGDVVELGESARTAEQAAQAVGVGVGQICKSLVFRGKQTMNAVLVVTSGSNRVDEKKISRLLSEPIEKADADFVREHTGYAIGGVPPIAHATKITTLIDEDLLKHDEIWAAAGHPNAVFKLTPEQLLTLTKAMPADVKQSK